MGANALNEGLPKQSGCDKQSLGPIWHVSPSGSKPDSLPQQLLVSSTANLQLHTHQIHVQNWVTQSHADTEYRHAPTSWHAMDRCTSIVLNACM